MRLHSAILILPALAALGCEGAPRLFRQSRLAMGSVTITIQVVAGNRPRAERAINDAFAAIAQAENLLSSHLPGSEISRLNRNSGKDCHLSAQTAAVLNRALEISKLTGGAFDVTAGPLIKIWKRTIETGKLPKKEEVAAAKKLVGYRHLVLGPTWAKLAVKGMNVDLGAIAKGHAVDKAIEALKANGIENALVDAGGDGYALGTRIDGTPWRVGIQHPRRKTGELLPEVLLLSDMAYATSGDYRQYTDISGVRYAHIVDPRTGQPARAAASVTVIAPDCTTADALATALSVLGPDEGVKLIDNADGVECVIITLGPDGLVRRTSRGLKRFIAE